MTMIQKVKELNNYVTHDSSIEDMEEEQESSNSYSSHTESIDPTVEENAECTSSDSEYFYQPKTMGGSSITLLEVPSFSDISKIILYSISFKKPRIRPSSSCSSITHQNVLVSMQR